MEARGDATRILLRAVDGDPAAKEELLVFLYRDLRAAAERVLAGERRGHTLQATALVHEAYLRLVDRPLEGTDNHRQFVRLAVRAMRNVVIDHARARGRDKRGGGRARVPLDDLVDSYDAAAPDLLALDEALSQLSGLDDQLGRIVELRFFGGLTNEESAAALGVSVPTIERGWRAARAWLHRKLSTELP